MSIYVMQGLCMWSLSIHIYICIHTPLHPSPHDLPMISLSEFDVRRATDARRV